MTSQTILYILVSGIIALLVALFQYVWKSKRAGYTKFLAVLRFLTIFTVLLLLVNPKMEQTTVYTEKPNLVVVLDNSESVSHLNQKEAQENVQKAIASSTKLNEHFNVVYYSLGNGVKPLDSLSHLDKETNIDKAFKELSQIYKNTVSPTILVTDGNQTIGNDYQFATTTYKQSIYPVILGDTITHADLKIAQLNVNKYAYLKNRYPIEAVVVYNGFSSVNSQFKVYQGNTVVYSEPVSFSKSNNSKVIQFTLPANSVGVQTLRAVVEPLQIEKNTVNNTKNFAVEVIDQKQRIAIVSAFLHPDLGMFKKSIESNEQREAVFLKPNELISQINDFQMVVLYQPNLSFKPLFDAVKASNKNSLVVVGPKTDLNFLNGNSTLYNFEVTHQTETYQGSLNPNYSTFIVEDLGYETLPPLNSIYGQVTFTGKPDVLLYKKLRTVVTKEPLLATFDSNGKRDALLLGENMWQWRAQSYLETDSFEAFDNFFSKLVQYLASNKRGSRLNVDYESFYNGNSGIVISVQYFNKNFEFDPRESLSIFIKDNETEETREFPFILKNSNYQVDLSSLPAGNYTFTVKAKTENISQSGSFTILEYNVEQQFLNADVTKLELLAENSSGQRYLVSNYEGLENNLLENDNFKPVQKSNKQTVPLIDFKYLLGLLALLLATEWFVRKYKGLI